MKKAMLMLILLVVCSGCFAADKPETEIKVGQVWKTKPGGDERKVFEVGEKYVVFGYKNDSDKDYPSIRTRKRFRRDYELVEQVGAMFTGNGDVWTFTVSSPEWSFASAGDIIAPDPPQTKRKPYLHKNPNNDHWICSKHGDLMPDYDKDSGFYVIGSPDITVSFYGGQTYCAECFTETFDILMNQHITGVKEND